MLLNLQLQKISDEKKPWDAALLEKRGRRSRRTLPWVRLLHATQVCGFQSLEAVLVVVEGDAEAVPVDLRGAA